MCAQRQQIQYEFKQLIFFSLHVTKVSIGCASIEKENYNVAVSADRPLVHATDQLSVEFMSILFRSFYFSLRLFVFRLSLVN